MEREFKPAILKKFTGLSVHSGIPYDPSPIHEKLYLNEVNFLLHSQEKKPFYLSKEVSMKITKTLGDEANVCVRVTIHGFETIFSEEEFAELVDTMSTLKQNIEIFKQGR